MPYDHPLIVKYGKSALSDQPGDRVRSYSGAVFRREFLSDEKFSSRLQRLPRNEDYISWIDLLETVDTVTCPSFVAAELGAGFGPWMLDAACLIRAHLPDVAVRLIGVEAEPRHFRFMQQAFWDNDLDPKQHRLINAAVGNRTGLVWFYMGESSGWYGQSVVQKRHVRSMLEKNGLPGDYVPAREGEVLETTLVYPNRRQVYRKAVSVRMISLADLIADVERVDFMHSDLQGNELDVVRAGREVIDAKVCLFHIGTHSTEIEEGLRAIFTDMGWEKRWDFPRQSKADTPFGRLSFGDGVQSWRNPHLS